jgi:hypothetical protein
VASVNRSEPPTAYPAVRSPIPGNAEDYFGTSPHNRARRPVHPSSASDATERHPAFAEFAPWHAAFETVILTVLIEYGESLGAGPRRTSRPANEAVLDWNRLRLSWVSVRAISLPKKEKASGFPDCYETKGDKQMKAMFRFSEHRFLSLVKA